MNELTPGEIQARFAALVGELDVDRQEDPTKRLGHPAILVRRLTDDCESLAGGRARLLLATCSENQELATHGWRTDLRILSDTPTQGGEVCRTTVLVIDEAAFHSEDQSAAVLVDRSQLWVEELVRVPSDSVDLAGPGAWLPEAPEDPNEPMVEPLHPVARRPHLIGSRLARDLGGGRFQTGLRAVSSARATSDGDIVVAVVREQTWYRWYASGRAQGSSGLWLITADELWGRVRESR